MAISGSGCFTRTPPIGATSSLARLRCTKVARYVDMPLQHISGPMLAAMQRETDGRAIRDLVKRIRDGIPGRPAHDLHRRISRRNEADVDELCDFIQRHGSNVWRVPLLQEEGRRPPNWKARFPEREGTALAPGDGAAAEIAAEIGRSRVGRTLKVLVEARVPRESDAPDIDGRIFVDPICRSVNSPR